MPKSQKTKNPRNPHGYEDFLGGDCWTRTSYLLRVKNRHALGSLNPLKMRTFCDLSTCCLAAKAPVYLCFYDI